MSVRLFKKNESGNMSLVIILIMLVVAFSYFLSMFISRLINEGDLNKKLHNIKVMQSLVAATYSKRWICNASFAGKRIHNLSSTRMKEFLVPSLGGGPSRPLFKDNHYRGLHIQDIYIQYKDGTLVASRRTSEFYQMLLTVKVGQSPTSPAARYFQVPIVLIVNPASGVIDQCHTSFYSDSKPPVLLEDKICIVKMGPGFKYDPVKSTCN